MVKGRLAYAEDLTRVFRHVIGVVLLSWQRILRMGLIMGSLALLVTEIVACLVTTSFPPPPATHLVAAALAFSFGYGAAVTMLIAMLLKGGIVFIRQLEGEVEIGTRSASVFSRREAGDLSAGIRRVVNEQRRRAAMKSQSIGTQHTHSQVATRRVVASAAVGAVGRDVAHSAVSRGSVVFRPLGAQPDTRRDPDDAIIRTPAPSLQSLPVSASRLPRIEWTYDETPMRPAPTQPPATPPTPPTPWRDTPDTPDTRPLSSESLPITQNQPLVVVTPSEPVPADATLEPTEVPVESDRTPDVPGMIPRGMYRSRITTRPLPAVTRPLDETTGARPPGGVRSGGLWERVSQALVGHPGAPDPQDDMHESQPLAVNDPISEDAWLNE